jgi:hypothetical protein
MEIMSIPYSLPVWWRIRGYSGDLLQENGEFVLQDFRSEYHMKMYSCCVEPYPDITYTIRLVQLLRRTLPGYNLHHQVSTVSA